MSRTYPTAALVLAAHLVAATALVSSAPPANRTLKLAVIAPKSTDHELHLGLILPAIELAIRAVSNPVTGILPGWDITMAYRDSNCSSTTGPLAAFGFYTNRTAGESINESRA